METSILEDRFLKAIRQEEEIIFISYSLLDDTEEKIKFVLAKILEKHQKEELFTPLYSCIKELIANANKANAKQILTDEGTIEDPENIIEVIEKVRMILNEKSQLEYGLKAKKKMLSTRTYLREHNGILTIRIINNLALPDKELKRISERIEKSSHYDSIAEIYIEDPDPYAEGMGLGLSMVVVLLKSVGVDHENFTVFTDHTGKTYAEMTIPLSQSNFL